LRETITAETNEEEEMEEAIKYNDILTNFVILKNIIDMSDVIYQLIQEGKVITREDMACLSPYLAEYIKCFGEYRIDLTKIPVSISNSINRALG
jgi:hypothetical protein